MLPRKKQQQQLLGLQGFVCVWCLTSRAGVDIQRHVLLFCVSNVQKVSSDRSLTGIGAEIQHDHPDDGEHDAEGLAARPVANGEACRSSSTEASQRLLCSCSLTLHRHPPINDPFKKSATPSSTPTQRARMKGLLRPHDKVHWSLAEPISGVKTSPRTGLRNQVRL